MSIGVSGFLEDSLLRQYLLYINYSAENNISNIDQIPTANKSSSMKTFNCFHPREGNKCVETQDVEVAEDRAIGFHPREGNKCVETRLTQVEKLKAIVSIPVRGISVLKRFV